MTGTSLSTDASDDDCRVPAVVHEMTSNGPTPSDTTAAFNFCLKPVAELSERKVDRSETATDASELVVLPELTFKKEERKVKVMICLLMQSFTQ